MGAGGFPFTGFNLLISVMSNWSLWMIIELREAQTMTMDRLKNTGEAVIIDVGEGRDIIHVTNRPLPSDWRVGHWLKTTVWTSFIKVLAIRVWRSRAQAVITFDHVGAGLYSFDVRDPKVLPYADIFKNLFGQCRIVGKDKVEVWLKELRLPKYAMLGREPCLHFDEPQGLRPCLSVLMISRW